MSNLTRRASHGTLLQGASQITLTISGYVVAVVVARELGPAALGAYGIIYSFLMATELIVALGIPGAVSRLVAEGHDRSGALSATGLMLIVSICLLACTVLWFAAPLLASSFQVADGVRLFRVAVLDVPFFGCYFLIAHVLNGRRDFAGQSLATFLYALTKIVGTAGLAIVGLTIAGALVVNIIASAVGLVCVVWRARGVKLVPQLSCVRPILHLAVPVAAITLGSQVLLNVDLWCVGAASTGVTSETEGLYVAAKNLARIPNLIAFVMNAVLIPSIAHAAAMGDNASAGRIIRGSMRFLALTLLPGCALVAVEARPLTALLFSEEYAAGATVPRLLVVANGLLQTLLSTLITILVATRHQREGAIVAIAALVPAVLLSGTLVSIAGATGGAIAAVASTAVGVVLAGFVAYRRLGSLIERLVAVRSLLVTVLVCSAAFVFPTTGVMLIIELVALGAVFLGSSVALGLVTRADWALFRRDR